MEANEEILRIISNETLDSAHDISIVTPTIYKSIFQKNASSHNADISNEDKLTDRMLNDKISMFQNMQEETSKNAVKLSSHTSKAISAIKEKDEAKLNEILKETQDLRKEINKLKEAVYKDELTHSLNRKWVHDNYVQGENDEFNQDGTLVIIDLNYFKLVNDTYGHIIGDKVLIFIANQLKKTKEHVVRYGGDEFIILFNENIDSDTALLKLNEIRENIISRKLKAGENSFRVSFSFGAYEFEQGDSLANVIELADKNMYNDKIKIKQRITGI
ncbi:MAG: GGDEF domain-containing protein [Sulfurimonas sp.]|nr:GGDEF domain-containing protein [Sulfurimonas sp.]